MNTIPNPENNKLIIDDRPLNEQINYNEMNIWKDPRVELPSRITDTCHGGIDDVVCIYQDDFETMQYCSRTKRFNRWVGWQIVYSAEVENIDKWCYKEDLKKQAWGK